MFNVSLFFCREKIILYFFRDLKYKYLNKYLRYSRFYFDALGKIKNKKNIREMITLIKKIYIILRVLYKEVFAFKYFISKLVYLY